MAETDQHFRFMIIIRELLECYFESEPEVYVSGNLLLFYDEGNKRKHVSPDAFVVKGVEKGLRRNYLLWEEGKGPDVVFEITSKSTKTEDMVKKMKLYQDVLCVPEYFLIDPLKEYLKPPVQGYRLSRGVYKPIRMVEGRLPSKVLGLHVECESEAFKLWNPETGKYLETKYEAELAERQRERQRADEAEEELKRMKELLAKMQKKSTNGSNGAHH